MLSNFLAFAKARRAEINIGNPAFFRGTTDVNRMSNVGPARITFNEEARFKIDCKGPLSI